MATTTNYGWTTPDDTDLVKDGAAAIRTLGSSIDTSFVADEGDLLLGGASDIFEPLAIGAADTVLTSNGTTASWAAPAAGGGLTLLSTTTLSGASTTISSISGTYKNLEIHIFGVTNDTATGVFTVEPNSLNTITGSVSVVGGASTAQTSQTTSSTLKLSISNNLGLSTLRTSADNFWIFTIANYSDATNKKGYSAIGGYAMGDFSSLPSGFLGGGFINTTSAIDALKFANTGGNFSAGTVRIYGVN
jgi:hypothetical protein